MNITRFFTPALLFCALLGATLKTAFAAPNTQRKIVVGPIIRGDRNLPKASELLFGEPVPLMTEMLAYARTGSIASGTKTAVYATVAMASAGSGFSASRSRVNYANGELKMVGKKGAEHFEGNFRVAQNSGDAATPFRASNAAFVRMRIYRNGRVFATYSVPIKKTSQAMSFVSNGADGFLWGRDENGSGNLISVAFAKSVSGATAPPVSTPPPPSGPRGMKVRVGGEIRVTNSDDGIADGQVEMFGNVDFNGQERWRVNRPSARDQDKGDVILLDYMTVDVYFDNPATWILKVDGALYDRDIHKGGIVIRGDDSMWNPPFGKYNEKRKTLEVDLKKMVEAQSTEKILYGDGASENANIIVKIRKLFDIN